MLRLRRNILNIFIPQNDTVLVSDRRESNNPISPLSVSGGGDGACPVSTVFINMRLLHSLRSVAMMFCFLNN